MYPQIFCVLFQIALYIILFTTSLSSYVFILYSYLLYWPYHVNFFVSTIYLLIIAIRFIYHINHIKLLLLFYCRTFSMKYRDFLQSSPLFFAHRLEIKKEKYHLILTLYPLVLPGGLFLLFEPVDGLHRSEQHLRCDLDVALFGGSRGAATSVGRDCARGDGVGVIVGVA